MNRQIKSLPHLLPFLLLLAAFLLPVSCVKKDFTERLLSDNNTIRMKALNQLRSTSPTTKKEMVPVLMQKMESPDPTTVRHASDALIVIGDDAVAPFITALRDPDPYKRVTAAEMLGKLEDGSSATISSLIMALRDPHPLVREEAAIALGQVGSKTDKVITALSTSLRDENQYVRSSAAEAMKKIGSP